MRAIFLISLAVFSFWGHADGEKSAFEQALSQESRAKSRESWIEFKGEYYRRVEVENGVYFMRYRASDPDLVDVYCEPPYTPKTAKVPEFDVETLPKSREYVQLLHDSCKDDDQKHIIHRMNVDPNIGLQYYDTRDIAAKRKKAK